MNYKYCLWCGEGIKKYANFCDCKSCGKRFYINSSPTASAIPIKDGKILLAKRAIKPNKGKYDFIGGFLNKGEGPEKGVVREAKEESGLDIKVINILGIYMDKYEHQGESINTINIYYIAHVVGGKENPQDDVASLHWFSVDKLPTKMAFNHQKKVLQDFREWYKKNVIK